MERCRKMMSWMALGVLLIGNVFTPRTYANENEVVENFVANELTSNDSGEEENNINDENQNKDCENLNDGNKNANNQIEDDLEMASNFIDNTTIFSENNNNIKIANADPDFDWEDCFERDELYIRKYLCDETEIVVPEKAVGIYGGAFEGKTINNITFLSNETTLFQQVFSGAVLQGVMTLPGENPSYGYLLQGSTIGEEGEITLNKGMRTYQTTILGKLIVDGSDGGFNYNYLLQNSYIDGTVVLSGFNGSIQYGFYGTRLTENGKIVIGEGVTEIYNSFQRTNGEGEILGEIVFPESLENIGQSFYGIPINSHINFPKGLKTITHSFYVNYNYPVTFLSGLYFSGNESLEIEDAFNNVYIDGDYVILGSGISLKSSAPSNISGNVVVSGENVWIKDGAFYHYQSGGSNIEGSVIISGNNIKEMRGFSESKVGEDFKVNGNKLNVNYGLSRSNISGDLILLGNEIEGKYGSMNDLMVNGNVILSGNTIDVGYNFFDRLNTIGNLDIKTNSLIIGYGAIQNAVIGGTLALPDNINMQGSVLSDSQVNNLVINKPVNRVSSLIILNNLLINNSDNAQAEEFSGISVGNNIYLSGEISKVGADAYKFSSGNIQPITLSATFSTGDIGEGAFCMEGKPLVVAYTKKKLTQAEKEYLKTHACLNAMGTYILTFKSGDRTETLEYDGRNINQIPVRERAGYEFGGWYESGATQLFDFTGTEILEDKTFYVKWNANKYKIIFDADGGNKIDPIELDCGTVISNLPTPTKECNEFSGWDMELPETMPAHDITLKAVWNYTCSRSSGGGGGAKKSESTTREIAVETPTENEHNSANEEQKTETSETNNILTNGETSNQVISVTQEVSEDGTVEAVVETIKIKNTDIVATVRTEVNPTNSSSSSSSSATHTKEQNDAYSFAKSNGITTTESIEEAKMNTELTRIQMAKMVSNYAINVLGQEPDITKGTVEFKDVSADMDRQYDNAVTKAYQLGIMGQNMNNNEFRPSDTVTRAEFTSALSRLLYHTEDGEYKGTGKYYIPHVAKLYNEGIINKADPKIKEKRGYVMTMLKRTVD